MSLLTGGARDLPERQRTLRNTLDWSVGLLSPAGQALLSRLRVFPGTFDLEAAEAVGGARGSAPAGQDQAEEIIDTLGSLADASLIRDAQRAGQPRFSLLETIRDYSRERLRESGQWKEAHDRHAAHFLELAESAQAGLDGPDQVAWLDRLEPGTITSAPRSPGSWTKTSPGRRSSWAR
jgi:predicted ATPase